MPRGNFVRSTNLGNQLMQELLRSVAEGLDTKLSRAFIKLADEIESDADLKTKVKAMNAELAAQGNNAIRSAYEAAGFDSRAYRGQDSGKFKRYPGAMKTAIDRGYFFNVSSDGALVFLNEAKLLRFAPHWRRLNYGALPAPTSIPKVRPMRFGRGVGRRSAGFKFDLAKSWKVRTPAIKIPSGFWSASRLPTTPSSLEGLEPPSGAGDALYPNRLIGTRRSSAAKRRLRESKRGVSGALFIDRGLDLINQEYPKAITDLALANMDKDIQKTKGKVR